MPTTIDMRGRHLMKLADYSPEEITYLIDLAAELKAAKREGREEQKLVGDVLAEAAVLDRVVHAAEHTGRVLHGLLVAHVRAGRTDEGDVCALVVGGDLERAAGARRVLLEDQRDLLANKPSLLAALLLCRL